MAFFRSTNYSGGENVHKVFVDTDRSIAGFFVPRVIARITEETGPASQSGREFNNGSCGL